MSSLAQTQDFTQLFINDTPLIDTRAPVEFAQGACPHAHNLPLMNDEQRRLVGTCYKNKGQEAAIKLGDELIQGQVKNARIKAWLEFIKNNPNGALYCSRGGLRSQITQRWIYETSGIEYPRVKGGFKALRLFLIDQSSRIMNTTTPIVIGGQTGCGKTLLLDKIKAKIDLEGLANHRGSAFGNTTTSQPSQINFEHELALELIKKQHHAHLVFEDEGSNIGTLHMPACVKDKTTQADLVLLKASMQERISVSMDAYVINMNQDFIHRDAINGFDNFANYCLSSLHKIQKRLGLVRYKAMHKMMTSALNQYQTKRQFDGFYPVVESLLVNYYDPMYDYQIKKKHKRIVFEGSADEVLAYLNTRLIS